MSELKHCLECGKPFQGHGNKIYCSPTCYMQYNQKKYHQSQPTKKLVCCWCKKTFENYNPSTAFCSFGCRAEYHRMRKRIIQAVPFDNAKLVSEIAKLEKKGVGYVLC